LTAKEGSKLVDAGTKTSDRSIREERKGINDSERSGARQKGPQNR